MYYTWVVVLCSKDYYTLFESAVTVKARTPQEAERKALKGRNNWTFVQTTLGPFQEVGK